MQEKLKPSVKLIGVDGNVFNIIGRVPRRNCGAGVVVHCCLLSGVVTLINRRGLG